MILAGFAVAWRQGCFSRALRCMVADLPGGLPVAVIRALGGRGVPVLCLDKIATYEFAAAHGIAVPVTIVLRDAADLELYKLMEINVRHNLSAMLAYRCGINFPWLEYRCLLAAQVPVQPNCEQGVYWIDITRDMRDSLSYLGREGYSLREFVEPYRAPSVFAVAARDDPRPALIRAGHTLAELPKIAEPRSRRCWHRAAKFRRASSYRGGAVGYRIESPTW